MSIVVETAQQSPDAPPPTDKGAALYGWIKRRVDAWRDARDQKHREKWDEYYRLWRGEWDSADKTRKSERSKLVAPATMQAVDVTVAEMEEAIFGREQWFDIDEDLKEKGDPRQVEEMLAARDRLLEKMEEYDVPQAVSAALLCGAIWGNGIAKIVPAVKDYTARVPDPATGELREVKQPKFCVEVISLEPYEFIPDPTTDDLDKMLGMAHETVVPLHQVKEGIRAGVYREVPLGAYSGANQIGMRRVLNAGLPMEDACLLLEYHGKVPAKYLAMYMAGSNEPEITDIAEGMDEDESLVEAIVTILNDSTVIRAQANPFINEDRSFVAYAHDTVPGYFWGRGIPEKAYNPQKALDADLRARIDAMGLVAHPMVAGDVTRLPRGMNLSVWPGKFWPTTGTPGDVLQPFNFGNINPALFQSAADMERMVSTATGAMDPAAAYNPAQAGGATNTALVGGTFLKRARRTMQNVERRFLRPLVKKVLLRYVQFAPDEFPQDYDFVVTGSMGIMAREYEQQLLTQLLSLVPNDSKPFMALLKAIFDNSSSPHKAGVLNAVDQMLNPPQDPQAMEAAKRAQERQERMQEAQVAEVEAKAQKAAAEAQRAQADAFKSIKEANLADTEAESQMMQHAIDVREVAAFEDQNRISMIMTQLRGIELAIKAMQAQAQLEKIKKEGQNLATP